MGTKNKIKGGEDLLKIVNTHCAHLHNYIILSITIQLGVLPNSIKNFFIKL